MQRVIGQDIEADDRGCRILELKPSLAVVERDGRLQDLALSLRCGDPNNIEDPSALEPGRHVVNWLRGRTGREEHRVQRTRGSGVADRGRGRKQGMGQTVATEDAGTEARHAEPLVTVGIRCELLVIEEVHSR